MTFIELFVAAWLGHFVGDYLLQNQWMAIGKSQKGWHGHLTCTVHVLLYTAAVAALTGVLSPLVLLSIAVPHWIIDRWSLAWYIIDAKNPVQHTQIWDKGPVCATAPPDQLERNVWKIAFAAPVYIFNDNCLHWLCLWFTFKYLVKV